MKFKELSKERQMLSILIGSVIVLAIASFVFVLLYAREKGTVTTLNRNLNRCEISAITGSTCDYSADEDTQEEDISVCSKEEFVHSIVGGDIVSSIEIIEGPDADDGFYHVVATTDGDVDEYGSYISGTACTYDFTEELQQDLNIGNDEMSQMDNLVYLGDGIVAYSYANGIYTQDLINDAFHIVYDKSVLEGNKYSDLESTITVSGPYLMYGEEDGIAVWDTGFIFYTDFVWGCESEVSDEYCSDMRKASQELCDKNLLGMWKYDIDTGEKTLLEGCDDTDY